MGGARHARASARSFPAVEAAHLASFMLRDADSDAIVNRQPTNLANASRVRSGGRRWRGGLLG
jgi:hypothetical protein